MHVTAEGGYHYAVTDLLDPRIPRSEFDEAASYGRMVLALLDGVYAVGPTSNPHDYWERLPGAYRALFVVYWALAEIYNGSLHQYFSNSTADDADELPAAARLFGGDAYADVFERANALFEPASLASRARRNERLDEPGVVDAVDALTDEFYGLEDAGDTLWELIAAYVEAHPDAFFAAP